MLRLNPFDIHEPETVDEVLALLKTHPKAVVLAGGTDFVPKMKRRQFEPPAIVSLAKTKDLDFLKRNGTGVRIGAMTTLRALERAPELEHFNAVREAAQKVATPIIRNCATLGGNLLQDTRCRFYDRSDFWREAVGGCLKVGSSEECRVAPGGTRCYATLCSDLAPALVVHDAEVILQGRKRRSVKLEDLYVEDGLRNVRLGEELLVEVSIPDKGFRSRYKKLRIRSAFDFPELGVAVAVKEIDDQIAVNIAVTGVLSSVYVLKRHMRRDGLGAFIEHVTHRVKPMDTSFFSPAYRKKVLNVFLLRAFRELLSS